MTIAPFAAAMHMLNASVPAVLADTVGVYQGGEPFGVLLGREGVEPFGAQAASAAAITVSFSVAHTPGLVEGSELVLGGVVHLVSGQVQPDESGWVTISVYPKP